MSAGRNLNRIVRELAAGIAKNRAHALQVLTGLNRKYQ
jgi:hypothetical protein